jgi:arylsulfatase
MDRWRRRILAGPGKAWRFRGLATSDVGAIRSQFHHVTDIAPTILKYRYPGAGYVDGITQKPIGAAWLRLMRLCQGALKRDTQYFEMVNHGSYHDGWIANTTPFAPPWDLATGKLPNVGRWLQMGTL